MLKDAKMEEQKYLKQDNEFNSSMFPESIKDNNAADVDLLGDDDGLLVQDDHEN